MGRLLRVLAAILNRKHIDSRQAIQHSSLDANQPRGFQAESTGTLSGPLQLYAPSGKSHRAARRQDQVHIVQNWSVGSWDLTRID
jgi:hypothetical protein